MKVSDFYKVSGYPLPWDGQAPVPVIDDGLCRIFAQQASILWWSPANACSLEAIESVRDLPTDAFCRFQLAFWDQGLPTVRS